ncbi:hypothetical protein J2Y67_005246 [Neobacillus niacini]|nr:hypothetical protein [Neobacillus niacini]
MVAKESKLGFVVAGLLLGILMADTQINGGEPQIR